MGLCGIIKNLDYFGQGYKFKMNGKTSSTTLIGFLLTISYLIIFLSTIYFFVFKLLDKENPILQKISTFNFTFDDVSINKDEFYPYILLHDNDKALSPDLISFYGDLNVRYDSWVLDGIEMVPTIKFMKMIPCSSTSWMNGLIKKFESKTKIEMIKNFGMCIDTEKSDITIFGGQSNPPTGILAITLDFCILGASCKSFEQMKNTKVTIGFIESYFDAKDYEEPFKMKINENFQSNIVEGAVKEFRVLAKKTRCLTDTGFIFESYKEDIGFSLGFNLKDSRLDYVGDDDKEMISVLVMSSNEHILHKRKYFKLIDLLTNVGGVIELIIFFIGIIYAKYNAYIMWNNLVRKSIIRTDAKKTAQKARQSSQSRLNTKKKQAQNVDIDEYSYDSLLKVKLINARFLKPKNNYEIRKSKFYRSCEELMSQRIEIFELVSQLNELFIFKAVFFDEFLDKIAPYVAIAKNHDEFELKMNFFYDYQKKIQKQEMNFDEALQQLENSKISNEIEKGLNPYMIENATKYAKHYLRLNFGFTQIEEELKEEKILGNFLVNLDQLNQSRAQKSKPNFSRRIINKDEKKITPAYTRNKVQTFTNFS